MTSLSLSKCLFCYKSASSSTTPDRRERIAKFLKGFQRHSHTNLPTVWDELSLKDSDKDRLKVKLCSSCYELIDSFNDLYDELKTLELRVDWVLDTIANKIKFANQVPARFAHFRLDLQTTLEETNSSTPTESIVSQVTAVRLKIQRKCQTNPSQFPRVVLKRRSPPSYKRYPTLKQKIKIDNPPKQITPVHIKQEPQAPPNYTDLQEFFPQCQLEEIDAGSLPFEGGHDSLTNQLEEGEIPEVNKRKLAFMCHLCNKTFSSQYACQIHLKTHKPSSSTPQRIRTRAPKVLPPNYTVHPSTTDISSLLSVELTTPDADTPEPTTSAVGQRQYLKFRPMRKHRRVRAPNKYFCGTCGKGCKDVNNLHYHKLTHANPATWKFGCPVCGKRFIVKQNLKVHMRVHSKVRPFVCQVCGVGYNHAISLRQHADKYHGGASMIRTFDPAIDAI